jgi:hypothetical protein
MDPSLNPWSSRPPRSREFRIVVNTIAGKSYEITANDGRTRVGMLKSLLRQKFIPKPRCIDMNLIFENNVLDDDQVLWECNIGEGSELDLVMRVPPRTSRSRSRSESWDRSPSEPEVSIFVEMSETYCREV